MTYTLTGLFDDGSTQASSLPTNARTTLQVPLGVNATIAVQVLTPSGGVYPIGAATLVLTVKKKALEDNKIQKTAVIAGNIATFTIVPADTKNLLPGAYIYDVWMTLGGLRNPVVPLSPFVLLSSVTPPP